MWFSVTAYGGMSCLSEQGGAIASIADVAAAVKCVNMAADVINAG